jgi:hypothetical protein
MVVGVLGQRLSPAFPRGSRQPGVGVQHRLTTVPTSTNLMTSSPLGRQAMAGQNRSEHSSHPQFRRAAASRARPSMRPKSLAAKTSFGVSHEPPMQPTFGSAR